MRRDRTPRTIGSMLVLGLIVIACAASAGEAVPDPSPMEVSPIVTASAPPTSTPDTDPTPAATMPALALDARTETDGVEVRLELDHNPLPAGEPTWATVTVRNLTDETVSWMTDGCASVASVLGILEGDWVGGAAQIGLAERFKAFALEPLGHAGQAYLLMGFTDERFLGREDLGCADTGIPHELAASERLTHRAVWDGSLDGLVPPDGPVHLTASFPRTIGSRSVPIEVGLESWIVGGKPFDFLTPAAAIDVALADATFAEWLERAPESTWINSTHTLDPEAGIWEIGLFRDGVEGFLGTVTLDARSGEVLSHRFE